jgi:uncharacterized repeat protein (TIGR03843 family)
MPENSPLSSPADLQHIISILAHGEIEVVGQLIWGSNFTFLVRLTLDGNELPAVYKPARGEQPLWDFPRGSLADREVAAYLTAQRMGWDFVPPTILRSEGPAGPGSLQLFIDADPERHYFSFSEQEKQRLRPVAIFDFLINNADRKSGHILLADDGHLWLIDHGVSFHSEYKLRTVIWEFVDESIPPDLLLRIEGLAASLSTSSEYREQMEALLDETEIQALATRAAWLLDHRKFPQPGPGRPYPWPLV